MYRMGGAILKAGRETWTSIPGGERAVCVFNSHPPTTDPGEGRLPEKCASVPSAWLGTTWLWKKGQGEGWCG